LHLWTYVSAGAWEVTQRDGHRLEFVVTTQRDEAAAVDLLAMTAYYHAGPLEQRLDVGHTIPIGAPWLDESACDHLLISVPYPYGPDLEVCVWQRGHARLLWLLPITEAERDFRATNGLEALEARFDKQAIEFWDPRRPSVA
jgi:Suppressor of fused protein (SUFU)